MPRYKKARPIKMWVAFTNSRHIFVTGSTIEEAADAFQERMGYYPDYNLLEPVFEKD